MTDQLTAGVLVRGHDEDPASWAMGSLLERLAAGAARDRPADPGRQLSIGGVVLPSAGGDRC